MPKTKVRPTRIFQFFILLLLVSFVGMIAVNFFSRSKIQPKVPQVSDEISPQKIEQQDKVQYFEDKKGRLYRLIKAERHFVGPDGQNHLEGSVEIVFIRAADGEDVIFSGEEIIYDMEGKHFRLKGNAEVKFKDTVIKTSFLEYFSETASIKSDEGIQIASKRFSGIAAEVGYLFEEEELTLRKNVELRLLPNFDPSAPIYVRADDMVYLHETGIGRLNGNVELTYKESYAAADHLSFELEFDKENIQSMLLQGNVFAQLVTDKELSPQGEEDASILSNVTREIKADEISIRNFQGSLAARLVEAKGNCHLYMVSSSGESRRIRAESMELGFTRQGKLKTFVAVGSVHMTEKGETLDGERYVQGEAMAIKEERKVALTVKGGGKIPATIVSEGYKITAGEIHVLLNSSNLEAMGGVKVSIDPLSEKQHKVGFFNEETAVYVAAGEMRYFGEEKRFLFKEKVKVWQRKDMLLTEELVLFRDTGKIVCSQGVSSYITLTPKDNSEDYQVGIKAKAMTFDPEESLLAYQEESSLRVKDITLRASALAVRLNRETGRMEEITAQGSVNIQKGRYEGLGKEANYAIEKEEIVLTGNPVLIDKIRGRTEGDKLTFHIADGRIIVENKERERSVSVIKS